MSLHRERQPWERRTQQINFRCPEAAWAIRRERIKDAGSVRRIARHSKLKGQAHIIRRARGVEFREHGKVSLFWAEFQPAPQPRILFASELSLDKRIEGAAHPLARNWTAGKLLLTHRTEFSSPCVAISSPLGVQGLGRHVCTHDDEVHRRQSSAVSLEELACRRASQPFFRKPDAQLAHAPSEIRQADGALFG